MADNFSVNGLLDKLLGGEPSSVAGFVDSDKYNSQKTFDRLLGGASGYNQAVNSGSGIATTLLNTLKSAQQGGRQTDNIYLNALKGQQQLTKGMLDVQKIQADLTKLGFENADLAMMNSQAKQILIEAYLNGDTETIKKLQLLGPKEYGKRLYPETEKTPYGVTQFKQLIKNKGFSKEQQNKLILDYLNAPTPEQKAKIQNAVVKDILIEYPEAVKYTNNPLSNLDVVNNAIKNTAPQNVQPQNQIGQNVDPIEVGIPSTKLFEPKDVETYQVGGYNTLPINNVPNLTEQVLNSNNVPVNNNIPVNNNAPVNNVPNLTEQVLNSNNRVSKVNEYKNSQSLNDGEQRYNNIPQNYIIKSGKYKGKSLHETFNLQPILPESLVAGQQFSIKNLQELKKDSAVKLQGAKKSVTQLNELHQNLSQLVHHKRI